MVSRLPVFSGKAGRQARCGPRWCCQSFVVVVLFFALLIAYPWEVMTVGTICYIASLPFWVCVLSQLPAEIRRNGRRRKPVGGHSAAGAGGRKARSPSLSPGHPAGRSST